MRLDLLSVALIALGVVAAAPVPDPKPDPDPEPHRKDIDSFW